MKVKGIHHISSIVYHPQMNVDFYTSLLGLRMIKKAVNYDDAKSYHFYYGNNDAEIGTVITAFPMGDEIKEGIKGGGQTTSIYYIIPENTMAFWEKRLNDFNVLTSKRNRFGKTHLVFEDEAGIQNELVESNSGKINIYEYNGVTKEEAIKGFYGSLINSTNSEATKDFFKDILGMNLIDEDPSYYRFELEDEIGKYIDLTKNDIQRGRLSKGTVHHIALTVDSLDDLNKFRDKVVGLGINVSEVKNRDFFHSIYFREPGGTVIELATREPGFVEIDDRAKKLHLPNHFEHLREELEKTLTPVYVKETNVLNEYKYQNKEEYDLYYNHQILLSRINELARLAKTRELNNEELEERTILRKEYIKSIRNGVTQLVDSVRIENADGSLSELERKDKKWNN